MVARPVRSPHVDEGGPMGSRVKVAMVGEVPPGEGRTLQVNGETLAVFNVEGTYYAIDNTCLHRGGPLGEGELEGRVVTCPWHAWRWDVATGANVNNPAVKVACFPVILENDTVFVEIT
jgi:nitrite reductase/ring-hydroxylating ferredoxin subunit